MSSESKDPLKIIEALEGIIYVKDEEIAGYKSEIALLTEEVKRLNAAYFGRSSERHVDPADPLVDAFDEDKAPDSGTDEDQEDSAEVETITYTRKKKGGVPGRKALPDYLERVRVEYALPESELIAPEGFMFVKIGEVITETLEIIPAKVYVIQHVRFQYACREREEYGVKLAPVPEQVIPKSIANPGLLAHVLVQKYCYHLPLYRQEMIWRDLEVNLPRNTLCGWVLKCAEVLRPLGAVLQKEILKDGYVHADETPVSVLTHKNGKAKTGEAREVKPDDAQVQKAYMWVYLNSFEHLVMYDYHDNRAGACARDYLKDFRGYIQSDAYSGYDALFQNKERISVGCMAHARRKFASIVKVQKKHANGNHALKEIKALYTIEKEIREQKEKDLAAGVPIDYEAIKQKRVKEAAPILCKLKSWMDDLSPKAPPKGLLGKALAYSLNNWAELTCYLKEGYLDIDNNAVENAIRPFAIGRKNWLFCGNDEGARAAALIYSLIESAKANHLKPFEYLKYVLTEVKRTTTEEALLKLLPHYAKLDLSLGLHYKADELL